MKKILVGVDLRATYVWLVVRAGDLARNIGGRADLLYASRQESDSEQAARRKSLEGLLSHLGEEQRGEAIVLGGEPRDVLTEQSANYDIMVVGPREPSGWRKLVEDAMAVQVIGRAHCPVFIPRTEEPKASFQRILLGLDLYQDYANVQVKAAGEVAADMNATLDIVFCARTPVSFAAEEAVLLEEVRYAHRDQDEQNLTRLFNEYVPASNQGKAFLYEDGPTSGVVELSKDYDAVIVGTADVAKAGIFLGSVAVDVVRHAHCDVLTLPSA